MSERVTSPTVFAIGSALRRRRKTSGKTLKDMARATGLSLGYISQVELASADASIRSLEKLCTALNITMLQLMVLADVQLRLPDIEAGVLENPPLPLDMPNGVP